jgi:hypothetical protein
MPNEIEKHLTPRPIEPTPDISHNPLDNGRSGSSLPIDPSALESGRQAREPAPPVGTRGPTPNMPSGPAWQPPKQT